LICFILFSAGENNKYALFKFVNAQYDPFQDFSGPQKPLKANTNNETGVNANAETTNDTKLNANANEEINPKIYQNPQACADLSTSGAAASGSQAFFPPSNAVDNNTNTYWSKFGLGSWIQLDLGQQKVVCSLDISWYKGNERINTFTISVSNDGNSFTNIYSTKSNGKTITETYDLQDVVARFLRITVNGNTQNNWVTIGDINVKGFSKEQGSAFNFVAVGDWSCNSRASETINEIVQKQPELVLALGDFSYTKSAKCWLDEIQPINDITRITIGNHDSEEEESSALEKEYLSHFNLARPFYGFDYQNVHFLMLSTQLKAVKGDEQYNFAESDLKQATSNPNTDWIIVAFHKPLYTSPSTHPAEIDFRNVYHPLFDQYNVDLVLQAHNHNYQRSYPLSYNQNGDQPSITDINKSTYNDPKGEIFVIAGTGGKSIYDIKSKSSFTSSQFEDYGILEVAISGASQLTGTFYSDNGNKILDSFTIVK
ncbi:MAG: discoidin domain-containing protein, partial [Nitrososphaeraceae archaeon]